jgi:putative aldouronate transport system permease protein
MKRKITLPDAAFVTFNTLFMLFLVVVMLYPFLNTLAVSFNNSIDSVKGGIYLWPRMFTTYNYEQVFRQNNLLTAFRNSIARTVLSTVGSLFVCSMTGYVLSRAEFVANKIVTLYFLLTMYVTAGLIPQYFLFRSLGLVGNFNVYWLPGLFGMFNVIVIRTYILGLPDSLIEAAKVDGAGEFRTFVQIVLPICKPVLATVGLWVAVGNWNDWFTSYIYTSRQTNLTTLQYELMKVLSSSMSQISGADATARAAQFAQEARDTVTPQAIRSTITIVAAVPILCVYPFLQKYFVKGVHVGSVKG